MIITKFEILKPSNKFWVSDVEYVICAGIIPARTVYTSKDFKQLTLTFGLFPALTSSVDQHENTSYTVDRHILIFRMGAISLAQKWWLSIVIDDYYKKMKEHDNT